MDLLNLMKTRKIKKVPVLLVGSEFWRGFVEWLDSQPIAQGYIPFECTDLLSIVDDLSTIVELVKGDV